MPYNLVLRWHAITSIRNSRTERGNLRRFSSYTEWGDMNVRGDSQRYSKLPPGHIIIFVSHEWGSYTHPDPSGYHKLILCKTLRNMAAMSARKQPLPLDMKYSLAAAKLGAGANETLLSLNLDNVWIWFDYISMPTNVQSMTRSISRDDLVSANGVRTGHKAVADKSCFARALSACVESSKIILILAPTTLPCSKNSPVYSKRRSVRSFRTWRRRGWCVLEYHAALLTRRSDTTILLVRNVQAIPHVINKYDVLVTSRPGHCEFTCCDTKHHFRDGTVECDLESAYKLLNIMVARKFVQLTRANRLDAARTLYCMKHVLLRGLGRTTNASIERGRIKSLRERFTCPIERLKFELMWRKDNEHTEKTNMTLLKYAVLKDDEDAVNSLLRRRMQRSSTPRAIGENILYFLLHPSTPRNQVDDPVLTTMPDGFVGNVKGVTNLSLAMGFASVRVCNALLDAGADAYRQDSFGQDPLMYACLFARIENVRMFLRRMPNTEINKPFREKSWGHFSYLDAAVRGPYHACRVDLVRCLFSHGATVRRGLSELHNPLRSSILCEDRDMRVVRLLIEQSKIEGCLHDVVHHKLVVQGAMMKCIYAAMIGRVVLYGCPNVSYNPVMWVSYNMRGLTALHCAFGCGDVEVAEMLMNLGAQIDAKTYDSQRTPLDMARETGFGSIMTHFLGDFMPRRSALKAQRR